MTVFDSIRTKNIEELVEWIDKWLDEHCDLDDAPWWDYFDNNYCKKCEPEIGYMAAFGKEIECAFSWCELNHRCKFFKDMEEAPNRKQAIKMWLESEENV